MLALLVAACFALAWVLRLGWLADYFSRPVLVGYIHGVAVVLIIGQLAKLLGLSIDARDPLAQLWEVVRELGSVSGPTVARRRGLARRASRTALPAAACCLRALLVVAAAIGVSWALDLQAHGVAVVGEIPAGLPSFSTEPGVAGRARAGAGGGRHLPGLVRGRGPDRALVRRQAQPARAGVAGAAGDGRGERRGRLLAGLLDRRERLAHGGQRQHGRAQPVRGPDRGRDGGS